MAELTLADLVAWEPRLHVPTDHGAADAHRFGGQVDRWTDRELTWVVTARASAPMLPVLRGGELVILPARVLAESGISLPLLLGELASHDVTGVVLDAQPPRPSPLPILRIEIAPPDLESELNRLLTQRRGEIYHTGTELGRRLTTLTASGGDLGQILEASAAILGAHSSVVDIRGATIARSAPDAAPVAPDGSAASLAGAHGWRGDHLAIPLASGETLWIGPVGRDRRALVRVAGERLAVAAEAALARVAQARPRGAARVSALATLLTGSTLDAPRAAAGVGLPAAGRYRVALAMAEVAPQTLQRFLSPLGIVHEAGEVDRAAAAVVELRADAERGHGSSVGRHDRPRGGTAWRGPAGQWIALSGVAVGAAALPEAARQARFVAALIGEGLAPGPVARFDTLDDLGPYRLLYRLWGAPDLAAFTVDALGELLTADRRGTLRETLLAYLDAGGSHVEAAARLGIHRNTLSYRLKQIARMTGHEPADPGTRLVLHLALLAAALPAAPPDAG